MDALVGDHDAERRRHSIACVNPFGVAGRSRVFPGLHPITSITKESGVVKREFPLPLS